MNSITKETCDKCLPNYQGLPAHHEAGPSSLGYIELCPSWKNGSSDNPIAAEGTILHAYLEGEPLPEGFEFTPNRQRVVEYCQTVIDQEYDGASLVVEYKEIKLPIHDMDGKLLTFGTVDSLKIYANGHARMSDFKFGFHFVEPPEFNAQGAAYALGVFQAFPFIESLEVRFIMARYEETLALPKPWTRDDYDMLYTRITLILERRNATPAIFNAIPKACDYCGNKVNCPALLSKALVLFDRYKDTAEDFSLIGIDKGALTSIVDAPSLGKLKRFSTILADLCKQIDEHVTRMAIEEGEIADGYEIAERKPSREFSDAKVAIEAFFSVFPMASPEDIILALGITPAKLDAAAKAIAPDRKGAEYVRILQQALAERKAVADPTEDPTRFLRAKKS